jgi:hypothetical protein
MSRRNKMGCKCEGKNGTKGGKGNGKGSQGKGGGKKGK